MIITPNGSEAVRSKKPSYDNTAEKAISNGFEDAMTDKGRECDYEFTVEDKGNVKHVLCEVKVDNGYYMSCKHAKGERLDLAQIERDAYKFLLERL